MLSHSEKERYSRHLLINGFDENMQCKLRDAAVLVIGAGGLGCPLLQYLAAAGVGQIGIVDADVVSLSNLQRQILFTSDEIGSPKADIAACKLSLLNETAKFQIYNGFLDDQLAAQIFPLYDVVVGCTDNFESRYVIDSHSSLLGIPFVHGSVHDFQGQLSVFNYKGSSSYTGLFGSKPEAPSSPVGVVGAVPGIIGSLMALEVLKIITGVGEVHANKLLIYDGLQNTFTQFPLM